jgi:hypothetical protein
MGGVTNTGVLEASNNGTLQISTVVKNAGGNITANGGAVQEFGGLTLTNSGNTIQGAGVIGNGALTVINGAGGTILANAGGILYINGTGGLTNSGTLQVNAGSGAMAKSSSTSTSMRESFASIRPMLPSTCATARSRNSSVVLLSVTEKPSRQASSTPVTGSRQLVIVCAPSRNHGPSKRSA